MQPHSTRGWVVLLTLNVPLTRGMTAGRHCPAWARAAEGPASACIQPSPDCTPGVPRSLLPNRPPMWPIRNTDVGKQVYHHQVRHKDSSVISNSNSSNSCAGPQVCEVSWLEAVACSAKMACRLAGRQTRATGTTHSWAHLLKRGSLGLSEHAAWEALLLLNCFLGSGKPRPEERRGGGGEDQELKWAHPYWAGGPDCPGQGTTLLGQVVGDGQSGWPGGGSCCALHYEMAPRAPDSCSPAGDRAALPPDMDVSRKLSLGPGSTTQPTPWLSNKVCLCQSFIRSPGPTSLGCVRNAHRAPEWAQAQPSTTPGPSPWKVAVPVALRAQPGRRMPSSEQ